MIKIVKEDLDNTSGTVVIESSILGPNAFEELRSAPAVEKALSHAAKKGLPDPRVNGVVGVYAVDKKGSEVTDPAKQKVVAYRADVPVTRRLL